MVGNFASDKQLFIQTANYKVGQSSLRACFLSRKAENQSGYVYIDLM